MNVVLNGHYSRSVCINTGDPQGSIPRPTSFLIFINDHPNVICFQLLIYADDTNTYSCLKSKFVWLNKIQLAVDLE